MDKEEFEFFDDSIPHWTLDTLKRKNKPSAFNGMVNVKRYKIKCIARKSRECMNYGSGQRK